MTPDPRSADSSATPTPDRASAGAAVPGSASDASGPDTGAPPVTVLLAEWRRGDASAAERLMEHLYGELRRLAAGALRGERADHTLEPTELVNEAYLRLVGADIPWEDRSHFYTVAARAMRRILVDHARRKGRQKRGGDVARVTLEEGVVGALDRSSDLLALDEALERLGEQQPRKGRVIELFYFAGLRIDDVARALEVSTATVNRDLRLARAWLYAELH